MDEILLQDIEKNISEYSKPSEYLNMIKNKLIETPLDILYKLQFTPQSKKYHPEGSVWNHTMMVVDKAAEIKFMANKKDDFMLAALLHDIGKESTTKKNKSGRWTSYNHDSIGAKLTKNILTYYNYNSVRKDNIVNLVKYHMNHIYIVNNLPFEDLDGIVRETDINDMILLFVADRLGRGNAEESKKEEIRVINNIMTIIEERYFINLEGTRKGINNYFKI